MTRPADDLAEAGGSRLAIKTRPPLPRTVILLGWVSFFADVSSEMIYPLLPLFVVVVLGASPTQLGIVEGVALATVAVMTAVAGWRSDRIRRRVPYVRWGYALPVAGKSLLVVAVNWPMVLAGRSLDRFGKGLRASTRDALLADAAPADQQGQAFGLHRAMDTAGSMVGVLLAAGLFWWFTGAPVSFQAEEAADQSVRASSWAFRLVFGISAALGVISAALTFLVRETPPQIVPEAPPLSTDPTSQVHAVAPLGPLGLPRGYWLTMSLLLIFALANSSDMFILLRASQVGLSPWAVVLAYAVFNLTYAVASYPAGVLSDRIGRWPVIGAGWALYAVAYAGFAITGAGGIAPLFALYGVYMALTDGVGKALIADQAPRNRRGTAIGLFYMSAGFATMAGNVLAGLLWDFVGPAAPFWFGAGAALAALTLAPLAYRYARPKTPSES